MLLSWIFSVQERCIENVACHQVCNVYIYLWAGCARPLLQWTEREKYLRPWLISSVLECDDWCLGSASVPAERVKVTCSDAEVTFLAYFGPINPVFTDDVTYIPLGKHKIQKERLYLHGTAFCTQLLLKASAHSKKHPRSLSRFIWVSWQERSTKLYFIMSGEDAVQTHCLPWSGKDCPWRGRGGSKIQ